MRVTDEIKLSTLLKLISSLDEQERKVLIRTIVEFDNIKGRVSETILNSYYHAILENTN